MITARPRLGEYHIDYGAWAGTVFCDLVTQGGGWTMLMKAQKGNTFGFDAGVCVAPVRSTPYIAQRVSRFQSSPITQFMLLFQLE